MAQVKQIRSGTGSTVLPDVGRLAYNGVVWSALYTSKVSGPVMPDNAYRTTKYVEHTLTATGEVTLNDGELSVDDTFANLRQKLSVHGAPLIYEGNGFGTLNVNTPGGIRDVAWGPVPKVIQFIPLGSGRSAYIEWQVTVHAAELPGVQLFGHGQGGQNSTLRPTVLGVGGASFTSNPIPTSPLVQYNWETSLRYDDAGYSGLSVTGTLEIPLSKNAVDDRSVQTTVDTFRQRYENIFVDLTKFKVTDRHFSVSRDKRTCEWSFQAEELPPCGLPAFCTRAGGTMSVRKLKPKFLPLSGTVQWLVTLRAHYTVRADQPRRVAAEAFRALWAFRMQQSRKGTLPGMNDPSAGGQNPQPGTDFGKAFKKALRGGLSLGLLLYDQVETQGQKPEDVKNGQALPLGFTADEGLYDDGKSTAFEAQWILMSTLSDIFLATGCWRYDAGTGGATWAASVQDIMGWRSWLINGLDPTADVIVDLGGGQPPGNVAPFG
jgi:hypothetical protein